MKTGQAVIRMVLAAGVAISAAGCGELQPYREGEALAAQGKTEASLERFEAAAKAQPTNARYRAAYLQARDKTINDLLDEAEKQRQAGKPDEARKLYEHVLALAPENARARAALEQSERDRRHAGLVQQAEAAIKKGDRDTALAKLHLALAENQQYQPALALQQRIEQPTGDSAERALSAAFRKPISLEFRDAQLRQVFEVLSRSSGLNFVFDKDVRTDQKVTVFLRNSSVADVVNTVLLTNQLEQRVLDGNSILIYPNTPAKQRDYQPLTVRTFVLSNSEAKDVANTLKTILKTRDIVVDEKRNMVVMRDTPEALQAAEKLVAVHEMPEPEVMLEVEILEVKRSRLQDLGIQMPSQLSLTPLAGSSGTLTLDDLRRLSPARIGATVSPLNVNVNAAVTDTNVLANPRVRTRNKEKARIQVGQRVPNVTTTSTATGFVAENIQYVDVGLKLEVEPTITPDNEVSIRINLEVSDILNQIQTKSGSIAYQLGTRNATTLLRLKDGENQILAGLIQDEDRVSGNRVPGLGDVPVLSRLFGSQSDNTLKSEIVLSITPRIIRPAQRPTLGTAEFDSGTESSLRFKSPVPRESNASGQGVAAPANSTAAPGGPSDNPQQPAAAGAASSLAFQGPASASPGATFDVLVNVQPERPFTSLPLIMQYNPVQLEIVAVKPGSLVTASETFASNVDTAKGLVYTTVNSKQSQGKEGAGNAVRLTLKALTAGETSVQMQNQMMITPSGMASLKPTAPLSVVIKP
ncbi:type IV pilus secretin PilQ [Ralstonia syzygii]|uniref:Secretion type II protein related to gspD (Secretin) protein n=1 Tax=Ralstonia syzygii R24 TaxID=907261 RepID=G3AAY0_9RALS|nr:type IV pilus secretin PilQ [Ralstonia syzygii]CCA87191.1 secretion type II protein related to gspD (secretin) protein [Ralstonia syzygii R24]